MQDLVVLTIKDLIILILLLVIVVCVYIITSLKKQ